jgi:integrase
VGIWSNRFEAFEMPTKLTKRYLDSLATATERQYIFDEDVAGFGVAVMPSGVRTFFVQYRTPGGRRGQKRRIKIGRYGAITVDEGRALAKKALADVIRGGDPAATLRSKKTNPTTEELGTDFLEHVKHHRKETTAAEYKRMWKKHVLPEFGSTLAESVTTAQVSGLHRRMRKTPYLANRVLALVGSFFTYAERQGIRPKHTNPAHDIEPYREKSRERFLTPAEVKRLGAALAEAERTGLPPAPTRRKKRVEGETAKHRPKSADKPKIANPFAVAAIRFLLLTGFREKEALRLRWAEIDLQRRVAVLPDSKTGRSVRRIGAAATELLSSLPRPEGRPYVFPGAKKDAPLVEINRVWYAVRHKAELGDVRLHDLRHSFASAIASAGGSLLMIRNLLGHKMTTTTAKYAHLLDDPVQATADSTADSLSSLLTSGLAEERSKLA